MLAPEESKGLSGFSMTSLVRSSSMRVFDDEDDDDEGCEEDFTNTSVGPAVGVAARVVRESASFVAAKAVEAGAGVVSI